MDLLESLIPSDFRRAMDSSLRRFFLGVFVNCFAMGLTLAFYVVYLHNVLHFSTSFATLLLAASSFAGIFATTLWGALTDRFGPVRVLLVASVTDAAALWYWAHIRSETTAILGGLVLAVLGGATWGPGSTLLVRLTAPEHRQRAYGFNFMMVNLAMGLGGLVSASVVDLHHPITFRWLYEGDAGVTLVAAVIYATLWRHGRRSSPSGDEDETKREGWATVLRDRRLVVFVLASLVLMLGGYSAIDAGLGLFVVNNLHLSVHVIGVFLFVDTGVIVLAQLFALNFLERRSRTRVMAVVGLLWAFFWLVLALSLALPAAVAIAAISVAVVVFALGETLMSPLGPAIVNEIAPEHLRGRYNAAQGLTWELAGTLAPAITAAFYVSGLSNWWPLSVAVLALVGGAMMLYLRRRLTPEEDGRVPSPR